MAVVRRAALTWLALLAAMVGNGTIRVLAMEPRLGEHLARQAASLTGCIVILALTAVFLGWIGAVTTRALFAVGALWLALTLGFELLVGRYVSGASWESLLADYDVGKGRLWPMVLIVVFLAPWLVSRARRRIGLDGVSGSEGGQS
jgi:hypothetical protein